MEIDVALVPGAASVAPGRVLVVVDEICASTTITTALDLGCVELLLAGDVDTARRLARGTGRVLVGEQQAIKPDDFDHDNSPTRLTRADLRGRSMVLCTTNGTAVVTALRGGEDLLIGCIRNARAVAAAAVGIAAKARDGSVQVVCAGQGGRFVLDDAVAAGVIASRAAALARAAGHQARLTDAAQAAIRVRDSFPSLLDALEASDGGVILHEIGCPEDIAFCAAEDASSTVPRLVPGEALKVEAYRG